MWFLAGNIVLVAIHLAFMARAVLRPYRDPSSRIAWVVVIAVVPALGVLAYILFGETSIGRKRVKRAREVLASLPPAVPDSAAGLHCVSPDYPDRCESLFQLGESVNGFIPVGGNTGRLMADSNSAIDTLVADMNAAGDHIHLMFYIWLQDNNGMKVVEALIRAAGRGVKCRAMADALGSRAMIRSEHWKKMKQAGVQLAVALPIGNPLLRPLNGRIDLRNHRKIVVIDDWITYCGSQNCADPEFRVKPRFAPWVDALMRFEGPIARQNQHVFISDWMGYLLEKRVGEPREDLRHLLTAPMRDSVEGFPAQVVATGPTVRHSAMPEMFETLIFSARRKLVITTPYYVPDESMQSALCAAAHRGVDTTIIFPARNDSWQVAAVSRSYYLELLRAGVKIHEYEGGLLHTKSMTVDDDVTLIGSANMDRRSFDLNYENNILFCDRDLTAEMRERQEAYLALAHPVSIADVKNWPLRRRFWNNLVGMMSPVL